MKAWVTLGLVLVIGLALFGIYRMGYNAGRDSFKVKIQEELLDKKGKMDEIRNNRPDKPTVIKRLRNGSF